MGIEGLILFLLRGCGVGDSTALGFFKTAFYAVCCFSEQLPVVFVLKLRFM